MILTPEYLEKLPPWMRKELAEKGVTEVYDHDYDWEMPWDQTPDFRIWKPYGENNPFLIAVNSQRTLDITGVIDGKLYTFYGCYPTSLKTSSATATDEVMTEIQMEAYPNSEENSLARPKNSKE